VRPPCANHALSKQRLIRRGAVKPSPRPQSVASMRFLESGVQTSLTGVAVSVCQLRLFRSAQIHYVNPPGTSFFATERELILRLAKSQDSGRSTSGHSLSFITSETGSTSYSRKRSFRLELNAIRWLAKKAACHMIQKESAFWLSPMVPATDAPICRIHKLFRPFTSRMKASNLPSGDATGGSASAASTICAIRGIWWRGTSKAYPC